MLFCKVVNFVIKCRRGMSTFVSKTNPVTGKLDWVVQNEDYDFQQEVARQVQQHLVVFELTVLYKLLELQLTNRFRVIRAKVGLGLGLGLE